MRESMVFVPASEGVTRRMRKVRTKDSRAETSVRSCLHKMGLRYRTHLRIFSDVNITPDILFSRIRLAVFIDGCFWHACPIHASWPKTNSQWWRNKILNNVARDRRTDEVLETRGWKVLRIWEHEEPLVAAERIKDYATALGEN